MGISLGLDLFMAAKKKKKILCPEVTNHELHVHTHPIHKTILYIGHSQDDIPVVEFLVSRGYVQSQDNNWPSTR